MMSCIKPWLQPGAICFSGQLWLSYKQFENVPLETFDQAGFQDTVIVTLYSSLRCQKRNWNLPSVGKIVLLKDFHLNGRSVRNLSNNKRLVLWTIVLKDISIKNKNEFADIILICYGVLCICDILTGTLSGQVSKEELWHSTFHHQPLWLN